MRRGRPDAGGWGAVERSGEIAGASTSGVPPALAGASPGSAAGRRSTASASVRALRIRGVDPGLATAAPGLPAGVAGAPLRGPDGFAAGPAFLPVAVRGRASDADGATWTALRGRRTEPAGAGGSVSSGTGTSAGSRAGCAGAPVTAVVWGVRGVRSEAEGLRERGVLAMELGALRRTCGQDATRSVAHRPARSGPRSGLSPAVQARAWRARPAPWPQSSSAGVGFPRIVPDCSSRRAPRPRLGRPAAVAAAWPGSTRTSR